MTNYEWLVKNKPELVKDILSRSLSKEKGIPNCCSGTMCHECDFRGGDCTKRNKEWFEKEHEPLYKKGDIVIGPCNDLLVVKKVDPGENTVAVSSYVDCGRCVSTVPITDIKKKVGHIEEESEV